MDFPGLKTYSILMAEKTLTDLPRDLRELYQKGTQALQRQNFDYAIAILGQLLSREPTFLEARQALRAAQLKKCGGSTSFFKKVLGGASNSPLIAKAQMAKNSKPMEAMQMAEQILESDPNSTSGHRILAEAATAAGLPKIACFAYEILIKNSSRDYDLSMAYGGALAAAGLGAKAETFYQELMQAYPHKGEISTALKNLSARKTLHEGGYEALSDGTGSYRDILKDKGEAVRLEQENRVVKAEEIASQLIREREARLKVEPRNLKLMRDIAELYSQKKDFDKALEYYEHIRASDLGGDPSLEKAIAETTLKRFDHQLSQLDAANPEQASQLAELQAQRAVFQLDDCRQRAERYPTDLQIKFELGQLYFQSGHYNEAISEFQRAQSNPQRRLQSLAYMGQCMAAKGMNEMGARKLQEALKDKSTFDDEKKETWQWQQPGRPRFRPGRAQKARHRHAAPWQLRRSWQQPRRRQPNCCPQQAHGLHRHIARQR